MKIKTTLFVLLMILFINKNSISQTAFQRKIESTNSWCIGQSIKLTNDGGYIIAGYSESYPSHNTDVFLVKTNSIGDTSWVKSYLGAGKEEGKSVQQTTDGGYIITGFTNSFGAGGKDVYLIKTDSIGTLLWSKTYGGINDDEGNSVLQNNDGGYTIVGTTSSYGAGVQDVYLIRTDSSGNLLFTKTYGGAYYDVGESISPTSDGGYIIAGGYGAVNLYQDYFDTPFFIGNGGDVYLIKTNSNGDTLWTKTMGDSAYMERGMAVKQTQDGGYIITGYKDSTTSNYKDGALLIKTDTTGSPEWIRYFFSDYVPMGYDVAQTIDGGYIIGGTSDMVPIDYGYPQLFVLKTDTIGQMNWYRNFGTWGYSENEGRSLQLTTDGGYIFAGYIYSAMSVYKIDGNGSSQCNDFQFYLASNTLASNYHIPVTLISSGCTVNNSATIVINSGTTDSIQCVPLGVNEINNQQSTITISPNPFTSQTTITFSEEQKNTSLIITDVLGNIILQSIINTKQSTIDMSGFAKGIYFVRIVSAGSTTNVVNRKIIKE